MRLQEEREEEEGEAQRERKRPRPGGLAPLGPVQPREDTASLPVPKPTPPVVRRREASPDFFSGFSSSSAAIPPRRDGSQVSALSPEAEVLAALKGRKSIEDQHRPSKKKKKNKRKAEPGGEPEIAQGVGEDASDNADSDEESDEGFAAAREASRAAHKMRQARDGGINWNLMKVESVKGKVSNDNRRLTDADLERRFGAHQTEELPPGMMTESQVLAMLQKERKGNRDSTSSHRRAQKELEEWTNIKAQRMARLAPDDKERLVVSRR